MTLAWITDPHLDYLDAATLERFCVEVEARAADAVVLSGDIATAGKLESILRHLRARLTPPIYFVLGNHDYYGASIDDVRARMRAISAPSLCWLDETEVVALSARTGLVGHGGWGDGRLGDFMGSTVSLNDYVQIRDLVGLDKTALARKLAALGDEAAAHARRVVPAALARFAHVVFVTHVPPYRGACWHEGRISDDDWLPHFSCKALGDALTEIMAAHPRNTMSVLCGHTHGAGEYWALSNLVVRTGAAEYGEPRCQPPITLP